MESLEQEISTYESQLAQVQAAITASTSGDQVDPDLQKLESDLQELIRLSMQNLLELKKKEIEDLSAESSKSLEGTKCRVPWGNGHSNAIVYDDLEGQMKVSVVFSHPTEMSMIPCKHYMEDRCKFGDRCKYSHGHLVALNDLLAFEEPDYSKVKVHDAKVLALDESKGIWSHGTVEHFESEDKVHVKFHHGGHQVTLPLEHTWPLDEDEEDKDYPLELDLSNLNSSRLGDWESGTKAIGSKLMAAMGYIHGQGLGKGGEGRVDPIPVMVYPSGKSLDWCMEMREKQSKGQGSSGVIYLDQRRKIKEDSQIKLVKANAEKQNKTSFFDLINKKLNKGQEKGQKSGQQSTSKLEKKELNVESLKTMERMSKVNKEIGKVEGSLMRVKDKGDRKMLLQKLERLKRSKSDLQSHEKDLEKSLFVKNNKRKLEIF